MKRTLSTILIGMIVLMSFLPLSAFADDAYSLSWSESERISYLSSKYKNGWYWNHWTSSDISQYGIQQQTITISGISSTISNKACLSHTGGSYSGTGPTCNSYRGSYQCIGFARLMYNIMWGSDSASGYKKSYKESSNFLDYAEVGDYCYFGYQSIHHAIFITGVDHANGTVTFADCNWGTKCIIRWNCTWTKEKIYNYIKGSTEKDGFIRSHNAIPSTPFSGNITNITFTRPTGSYTNRLSALQETFPAGWYWNTWTAAQLGSAKQHNITIGSHTTSISTLPCGSTHSDNYYWGAWNGSKGCGFARMMFDLTWNMDTEADSYCYIYSTKNEDGYFLNYLSAGDMVYDGSRYYYVTGVSGNTVTYGACNLNGNCDISWNNQTTKQALLNAMSSATSSDTTVYICSPSPKGFSASTFNWDTYEVKASSLTFKRSPINNSRITNSYTLSAGARFEAASNHIYTNKSGENWVYCKNSNNEYGWAQLSDSVAAKVVTVVPPSITTQPKNATVTDGEKATFKIVASGDDLSYQWQYSTDGTTWKNNTATAATFSFTAKLTQNGYSYRCIVTNAGGSVTSNTVKLTVNMAPPSITTQPKNVNVADGEKATFKIVASGDDLSYQWQYSTDGTTWKNNAVTAATLSFTAKLAQNGYYYRCIVTNAGGSVTSNAVKLTVESADGIPIDAASFPDAAFRAYVADELDANGDGKLGDKEITQVKTIDVSGFGTIRNIKGVAIFTELQELDVSDNDLTELDVSRNTKLKKLTANNNQLTSLDLSKNTKLQTLICNNNVRTVQVKGGKLDVTDLGITASKMSELNGAALKSNVITAEKPGLVTYTYDCGNDFETTFTIKLTASKVVITSVTLKEDSFTYTGVAIKPDMTVKAKSDGKVYTLKAGQYKVTYKNNKAAGTAKVTVTGTGFFKGTISKSFEITGAPLTSVKVVNPSLPWNGKAHKPILVVKAKVNGKTVTLTKGTKYTATYTDNIEPGTATVTVKGKGNYSGTLKTTFKINKLKISAATVTLNKNTMIYTGKAIKPKVTVKAKVDGKVVILEKGTDYTVTYKNNVDAGTATVTIKGKGHFTGTQTVTFTIKKK